MNFGQALAILKDNRTMTRTEWEEKAVVKAQFPNDRSKITEPYIFICAENTRMPWVPGQRDMFAEDWYEVR